MQGLYDRTSLSDPRIELVSWSATSIGNNVGEKTFCETQVDNCEPAHNTCFLGSSAANRLIIAPPTMATNRNGPTHGKSFEYEYAVAVSSGAIFPSPSKDAQFYAGC